MTNLLPAWELAPLATDAVSISVKIMRVGRQDRKPAIRDVFGIGVQDVGRIFYDWDGLAWTPECVDPEPHQRKKCCSEDQPLTSPQVSSA